MFAIRLLPTEYQGPDGERLGEIVVDGFRERFACHLAAGNADNLEARWRSELAALVGGEPLAVLQHDPRFAWLVYREGGECFVQQRLSLDGTFAGLMPRAVTTDEGSPVSTWVTSVAAIRQFLDAEQSAAADPRRAGGS